MSADAADMSQHETPQEHTPRSLSSNRTGSTRSIPSTAATNDDHYFDDDYMSNDLYDSESSSGSYTQGLADEQEIFDEVDAAEQAMVQKFQMTAHSVQGDVAAMDSATTLDAAHVSTITASLEQAHINGDNFEDSYEETFSDVGSPRSNQSTQDDLHVVTVSPRVQKSPITVPPVSSDSAHEGSQLPPSVVTSVEGTTTVDASPRKPSPEDTYYDDFDDGAYENGIDDNHNDSNYSESSDSEQDTAQQPSAATGPCFVDPKMQTPLFVLDQRMKKVHSYVESSKHFPGFGMYLVDEPELTLTEVATRFVYICVHARPACQLIQPCDN